MEFTFGGVVSESLNNSDCQTILSAIENEDLLTLTPALLLFPLEEFFDSRMLNYCHPLIMVEKPLDYFRYRIIINVTVIVATQPWPFGFEFPAVIQFGFAYVIH